MPDILTTLRQARLYVGPSQAGRRMCYCPRCKRKARIPEGAEFCSTCMRRDIDRALRAHAYVEQERAA